MHQHKKIQRHTTLHLFPAQNNAQKKKKKRKTFLIVIIIVIPPPQTRKKNEKGRTYKPCLQQEQEEKMEIEQIIIAWAYT